MRYFDSLPENFALKMLALLLAVIIWFFITMAQEKTSDLTVPVVLANMPPRMKVAEAPPSTLRVGISGPGYALAGLERAGLAAVLDLKDAGPGTVAFANLDRLVRLRDGLHVIRVQPAKIELTLVQGE